MFRIIALTLLLALPFAATATAQSYDWRTVLTQSVKSQMRINLQFEVSKKRQVAIHFTMGVPFSPDTLITRTRFPEEQGNLGELMFMTPDEQLMEFVTFSVGTVGGDTLEEKMKRVFAVIDRQVYPSLTPPADAQKLGGRNTKIGGHPAIEFVSLFNVQGRGPVAARIVGVLAPNQKDVVFVVQQVMRDQMGLGGPDELSKTFGGSMASSITFQAYRDENGKLVKFQ